MKYFSFIAIAFISILFVVTGCEKCRTCSYSYMENGEEKLYRSQSCGSSDDLSAFETFVSERADSLNVSYACTDE